MGTKQAERRKNVPSSGLCRGGLCGRFERYWEVEMRI